jgi:uncharacterized protein
MDAWSKIELKEPMIVVAVSTSLQQYKALYSQGRELAKYLLKTLEFKEVATLFSSSFAPEVIVGEDGVCNLPSCRFYLHRGMRDLLLFAGDASPMDDQYEFTRLVLDFAKKCGVTELYSIGARWSENPISAFEDPEVNGFASDVSGVAKLEKHGVRAIKGEPAPFFSSLVVGLAKASGIEGFKLSVDHGEPIPHTRAVLKMLKVLMDMGGFEVDLSGLNSQLEDAPITPGPDERSAYR